MGTRSLTFVHEDDGPPLLCIYQQYDGYFTGVGDEILTFLKGSTVVNGFGVSDARQFNGAGDLAARLVTHYKGGDADAIGNVYIESPDRPDDEEYSYHIHVTVGQEPRLVATEHYSGLTVDAPASEIVWPVAPDEDDEDVYYVAVDNSPLREDQRRALFATFNEVFADSDQDKRIAFTAMALGKDAAVEAISWSPHKPGALTVTQASMVLDALDALNV